MEELGEEVASWGPGRGEGTMGERRNDFVQNRPVPPLEGLCEPPPAWPGQQCCTEDTREPHSLQQEDPERLGSPI